MIEQLFAYNHPYLGLLGPRSRTDGILQAMDKEPLSFLQSNNFYAPVGLDIGAETPSEIALSILAEIQTVSKGKTPKHLRDSSGAIHERNCRKELIQQLRHA